MKGTIGFIFDKEGQLLTNGDSVFDIQAGQRAIFRQTPTSGCWLQWEDGYESWLLDPSMLVKETFNVLTQ